MDWLFQYIGPYWRQALAWWHSLGPQGPYYVWLVAGAFGFLIWLRLSYYLVRRLLGHRKIYGVWFRPGEIDLLLDRLELSEKNGTLIHARELNLLDRYRPDRSIHLKRIGDADFVGW